MTAYSADKVLGSLKDFQRASVEHAFRRLYVDGDSTRRFLIADETGLGKTMVAKGLIAKTIERLQHDDSIKRIDIVYVCSNADIAEQNLRKLRAAFEASGGDSVNTSATRLTMLVSQPDLLVSSSPKGTKPVTFVSFTPATSFDFGWQTGKASERAVLYWLLSAHLELGRAEKTALKRILQGTASMNGFERALAYAPGAGGGECWEPSIQKQFYRGLAKSGVHNALTSLIEQVRGRPSLTREQDKLARELTGGLRRLLARASVSALTPDLVILDEFQRFKELLADPSTSEVAELSQSLFTQPDARVVLLSATPYKPFTLAEEKQDGDDHYKDLFDTLAFLAQGKAEVVEEIRDGLAAYRKGALSGAVAAEPRQRLESSLLKLLSRVERSTVRPELTREQAGDVESDDIVGYAHLHKLASAVKAPLSVEYWKSAPYFINFLSGYKVGEKVREALKDPAQRASLKQTIEKTQRIRKKQVDDRQPIEWGNARLRQLASETVEKGWWKLLWVPASLPYYAFGGPFAEESVKGLTKRLVFSSWIAAPSAIASLLSYNVECQLVSKSAGRSDDAQAARLRYRVKGRTAGSMTTLALFWPMPALAEATDPLAAARTQPSEPLSLEALESWGSRQVEALGITNGTSRTSASSAWYWSAAVGADARTDIGLAIVQADEASLADALTGVQDTEEGTLPRGGDEDQLAEAATEAPDGKGESEVQDATRAHIAEAKLALWGKALDSERPADLVQVVGLLGVASPANVAWRALRRLAEDSPGVTPLGLWQAAALLASGFRALFNRPEVMGLLDELGRANPDDYWKSVLSYCRDGNLQAVVDEYLHHLAEGEGIRPTTDEKLRELATRARDAIALRAVTYSAVNADDLEAPLRFPGRFALRYGGLRQSQEDLRLPEVRAAFNSPFWPFVLATTSIGQEGVDFHWWCHAIVHWNLPSNPVDFEQREGRVNRFMGHAIRRNVAAAHRADVLSGDGEPNVWKALFDAAVEARESGQGDMHPFWHYPGEAVIERSVMGFPMSRDLPAWQRLKDLVALYRLAYGQPRQEDMLDLLQRRGVTDAEAASIQLRLVPPMPATGESDATPAS